MRRELLHLMLSWPMVTALVAWSVAQDGPQLPGFESLAPIEGATAPSLEPESTEALEIVPYADDIRPLDADGIPQSGPPFRGQLRLPEPPAIEPDVAEPPKRNWLQKSTEAVRGLTKPESRGAESKAPAPKPDDKKSSDAIRNWQMLRRQPAGPGQTVPGQRVQPQGAVQPQQRVPFQGSVPQRTMQPGRAMPEGAMQSKRSLQSQQTAPSQPQTRPPASVDAKNRASQQPTRRRQVQAAPGQRVPQAKSQVNASAKAIDLRRTADNGPRSPWERSSTVRLRPAAPAIKAAPTQGTGTKPTTLRSALGFDGSPSK